MDSLAVMVIAAVLGTAPLEFDRVSIAGGANVELRPGQTASVQVACSEQCADGLVVEVVDRVLYVDALMAGQSPVAHVEIVFAQLKEIVSHGDGDIRASDIASPQLAVDIQGGGNVELTDIAVNDLSVTALGAAHLQVTGQAAHQFVALAGSASYSAVGLSSRSVHLHVRTGGSVEVFASDWLAVDRTGNVKVRYGGDPKVFQHYTGGGQVAAR